MRILLTGGTGFLGNNLARALLADGHEVTATVRHSSDPRPLSGLAVETIGISLLDQAEVNLAVAECDLVLHAAALIHIGWKKMSASRDFNVQSTRLLAEAARRKNVRMIHVSTVDALAMPTENTVGDESQIEPSKPACAYVVSKRESETVVLDEVAMGLDAVIVNPGFMVGPWDWKPSSGKMMLGLAKIPVLLYAPGGGCTVVDVRDVAEGIVSAMKHGQTGQRYILGGQNISYLELWQLMAGVIGKRPPVRKMSNWLAASVGKFGDAVAKVTGNEPEINSAATQMGQLVHWYSSQKAETELGYKIGKIDDALQDAWDWFQQYEYVK